jgi:hypothetical protein
MSSAGSPREPIKHFDGYNREELVFINCPFDPKYPDLFNAIVFAVVCCGLIPVWTDAIIDQSISRINKIIKLTSDSKYSIHDLCRCHGEGEEKFARLIMPPLDLGISIGSSSENNHQTRDGKINQHKWFALVPSRLSTLLSMQL